MGNPFTGVLGKVLTMGVGNCLTGLVGKVLDIYTSPNMIEVSSYLKRFREKCIAIPLGIDVKRFKLTEDNKKKVAEIKKKFGPEIVLFVGRLIYYKGLEYLIQAMQKI